MTLLMREDLTDADLAWAAQAFAPRPVATAAPTSPAPRGRARTLMGLGSLAAVAGLALALSANVGATPSPRAPDSLAGGTPREAVAPGWTVQSTVQDQLRADLADQAIAFSLVSAQSTRLDGGARRFDGSGLARIEGDHTRFVAFTLTLDRDGRIAGFDYGLATGGETAEVLSVGEENIDTLAAR